MNVVLATCGTYPDVTSSDALLQAEFVSRGHRVEVLPWNGVPSERFIAADLTVLRSTWDYHAEPERFETWLDAVSNSRTLMANPASLIRWNLSKRYLLDLMKAGLPVPHTRVFEDPDPVSVRSWLSGRSAAVLKPAVGASGHGVSLVDEHITDEQLHRLLAPANDGGVVAQEYIEDIGGGELALVFFGRCFSHAFRRVPAPGEFRVNGQFGGRTEPAEVDEATIAIAAAAIEALPQPPVYVRVDLVATCRGPVIMEVEAIEPALCLDYDEHAARRFADALLAYSGS
jgi:glutathione synthase/RimK-type ligase-like ATP-grasp enzyme